MPNSESTQVYSIDKGRIQSTKKTNRDDIINPVPQKMFRYCELQSRFITSNHLWPNKFGPTGWSRGDG